MSTHNHLTNTPGDHAPPQQFQHEQHLIFHTSYLVTSQPRIGKTVEIPRKKFWACASPLTCVSLSIYRFSHVLVVDTPTLSDTTTHEETGACF